MRKNDWGKEITVQNRFQIFKAAGTTTYCGTKKWSGQKLWKCSCTCPLVFISSCKYGGNIQFLLVHSSKLCVHFKQIFGLHAVLLDRQQDIAFGIIKAQRNIHYCYPLCPSLG